MSKFLWHNARYICNPRLLEAYLTSYTGQATPHEARWCKTSCLSRSGNTRTTLRHTVLHILCGQWGAHP